jgi:ABC-type phosphate transport system substrate-binding protein
MRPSLVAFVAGVALTGLSVALMAETPVAFRIVVNPSNPRATLERRFVADLFLKKVKTWPDGTAARPVDLEPNSEVRRRFSQQVVGRSLEAVRAYWQQCIFSGRDLPPPELDSDEHVLRYVMRHPGSIGYVSGTGPLDGAKVVTTR